MTITEQHLNMIYMLSSLCKRCLHSLSIRRTHTTKALRKVRTGPELLSYLIKSLPKSTLLGIYGNFTSGIIGL